MTSTSHTETPVEQLYPCGRCAVKKPTTGFDRSATGHQKATCRKCLLFVFDYKKRVAMKLGNSTYECDCGRSVKTIHKTAHIRTRRHLMAVNDIIEPEPVAPMAVKKERVNCECGAIGLLPRSVYNHGYTQRHKRWLAAKRASAEEDAAKKEMASTQSVC